MQHFVGSETKIKEWHCVLNKQACWLKQSLWPYTKERKSEFEILIFKKRICVHAEQTKYCSFFNVILAVATESITRKHNYNKDIIGANRENKSIYWKSCYKHPNNQTFFFLISKFVKEGVYFTEKCDACSPLPQLF